MRNRKAVSYTHLDTGEQIGVVSARDAQKMADEKNLDLVKISPQAKPPAVSYTHLFGTRILYWQNSLKIWA